MVSYGMAFTTLISTAVLAKHIDDPAFAIVDCRSKLDEPGWGARVFAAGHIPGALYADLASDLSGQKSGVNGRHPLPDPQALAQTFGRFGITSGVQVVAYDQENGMFASRLWWLLRWMGHGAVAVLDGGYRKWTAEERPIATGDARSAPRTFTGSPNPDMTVDVQALEARLRAGGRRWSTPARRNDFGATPNRSTRSADISRARRTISSSGTSTRRGSSTRPKNCARKSRLRSATRQRIRSSATAAQASRRATTSSRSSMRG